MSDSQRIQSANRTTLPKRKVLTLRGNSVVFNLRYHNGELYFVLKNCGKKPVKNIQLELNIQLPVLLEGLSFSIWNESSLFSEIHGTLAPGETIECFAGLLYPWLTNEKAPKKFSIKVNYIGCLGLHFQNVFPQNILFFTNIVERHYSAFYT